MSTEKKIKFSICITFFYIEERLNYLSKVCNSLNELNIDYILTIITNTDDQLKIRKIKRCANENKTFILTPTFLGHPYLLTWSHFQVFENHLNDQSFTHFLYLEDDIKIEKKNIEYWFEAREILKPFGFYPSFFRIEYNNQDNNWYSTDVMKAMSLYDCKILNINNLNTYISIVYPYQGMYLLDRELMKEHFSGSSFNPDYEHLVKNSIFNVPKPKIREKASLTLTYVNVPKGYRSRNLLPYDKIKRQIESRCMIHHLPNNYTNDPTSPVGKIKISEIFVPKTIKTYLRKKIKVIFSSFLSCLFTFLN